MTNQHEYADAINTINRRVAAGEMTDGEADVWRQKLLAESTERPRPMWVKVLIVIVVVVVGIILLRMGFATIR